MPILMSLLYLAVALGLLALCITLYLWTTPCRELALIRAGNTAAALSLGGASLGLALPIASAIYFTHDLVEMAKWAAIGCAIQFILFQLMRSHADAIEKGNVAAGLLLAFLSVASGMLVAVCIS